MLRPIFSGVDQRSRDYLWSKVDFGLRTSIDIVLSAKSGVSSPDFDLKMAPKFKLTILKQ